MRGGVRSKSMRGVPVEPLPLTREDRTILALERGAVVGHTCKVLLAGSAGCSRHLPSLLNSQP